jgi:Lar family restriction alleviation protein
MIKPCPFCGGNKISTRQGSTFRWRLAQCDECGATSGEVRRGGDLGDLTDEEWEAPAVADALKRWNERAEG